MSVKINLLNKEELKVEYNITIPKEDIAEAIEKKLPEIQKKYKADGFRVGKVPLDFIMKKEGKTIFFEIGEELINKEIFAIVDKESLDLLERPNVDVKEFKEDIDLEFKVEFVLLPKIPEINLSEISLEKLKFEVTDVELNTVIDKILSDKKDWKAKEGKAELGNLVKINFNGKVEGVEFNGGKAENYELELGTKSFIDTFEEQLVGFSAGEKTVVKVKFPEEYQEKSLAGKNAEFDIDLLEVLEAGKPELTDEFIKKTFNVETVEQFKTLVKAELEKSNEAVSKNDLKDKIFNYFNNNIKFTLNDGMVKNQYEKIITSKKQSLEEGAEISKEDEKEAQKSAENSIRAGLILSKFGKDFAIEITEADVSQAIFQKAMSMPGYEKMFIDFYKNNKDAVENLKGGILEDKVFDMIIEKIKTVEKITNKEEYEKNKIIK